MAEGRLNNSMKNLLSGYASRGFSIILGLVVRSIFIRTLGNDYLSINGLYSNILGMLSLAEMGFGVAMVYSMYKPLQENDTMKLASLTDLYKRVYRVIGFVVLGIGLAVIPFMDYIIKDPPAINHLTVYYLMFLLDIVLSYWFFAYRRSIFSADQKEYLNTNTTNIFNFIKSGAQIVLLIAFHNFFIYLATQLLCTVLANIVIAHRANKLYPALSIKHPKRLAKEELRVIKDNVKALMLSRISFVILNSTDNIIISAFVGVSWVGLLSNFTMIVENVVSVISQFTSAITASLGNYFLSESKEDGYRLFKRVEFIGMWAYGICAVALWTLLNPFVTIWLGSDYNLADKIIFALALNFFVQGFMSTLWTFRSTLGLFKQGWFRPLVVAGLNVFFSILLGIHWGTFGVLIATFFARALVNLWYDPWVIHKHGFDKSVKGYYLRSLLRALELVSIGVVMTLIRYGIMNHGVTILNFILLFVITGCVCLAMFWLYTHKMDEYHYFMTLIKERIPGLVKARFKK
ncbi:MAG: sugar translocase [Eubacterium sp.]|nr:sugar translocase [Eubacterium sp.]